MTHFQFTKIFCLMCCGVMIYSCNEKVSNNSYSKNQSSDSTLSREQEQIGIKYLSIDSVYTSPSEKERFDSLKKQFISVWQNDSNCYRGNAQLQKMYWEANKKYNKEVRIGNILHSKNYDTLLILVAWYFQNAQDWPQGITQAVGMGVIVDAGQWHFHCEGGTSYVQYTDGNHCMEAMGKLKLIISQTYFVKNSHLKNPAFWSNLYKRQ